MKSYHGSVRSLVGCYCPLVECPNKKYPEEHKLIFRMSALCQKRTFGIGLVEIFDLVKLYRYFMPI